MAELLLGKAYEVWGMVRRASVERFDRVGHILRSIRIVQGDLADQSSLDEAIKTIQPDEVYNLAAQSFAPASWNQPVLTADTTGIGVMRILEAIRKYKPDAKLYQASSNEVFGNVREIPQKETTPFCPRNPYGAAKAYAHWITVSYRQNYNIFACCGISFNHESPRRGFDFLSRKVTSGAAKIKFGLMQELQLGNLESRRDWGFAGDYVEAAWLMLQQDQPEDYVISTGECHAVKEWLEHAFDAVGLDWEDYVKADPQCFRPAEEGYFLGDSSKARARLKWKPAVSFSELVKMMVEHDCRMISRGEELSSR